MLFNVFYFIGGEMIQSRDLRKNIVYVLFIGKFNLLEDG